MKFVVLFKLSHQWQAALAQLRREFPQVEFIARDQCTETDIAQSHGLITDMVTLEQLRLARALQIIFLIYTGPNFLPLDEIRRRRIRIANTHGNAQSVAERGMALTLGFYGKLIDYHRDLQQGKWHGAWGGKSLADTWDSLQGKRCALIGTGEIGRWLAKFLKVFGCEVVGYKQRPVKETPQNFDRITLDLFDALEGSELVFISLPLTRQTENLFDAEVFSWMQGKFLVNLGRGGVVEEAALYHALKSGLLKGAAIDVWYAYPCESDKGVVYPSRFPFHELPNVVLSPHVAGFTKHAVAMNMEHTIDNIRCYLKTGQPRFEIDPERMY